MINFCTKSWVILHLFRPSLMTVLVLENDILIVMLVLMLTLMDTKMVMVMDTLLNWLMSLSKKAKEVQTGGQTANHYYLRTNTASFTVIYSCSNILMYLSEL